MYIYIYICNRSEYIIYEKCLPDHGIRMYVYHMGYIQNRVRVRNIRTELVS